MRLILSVLALIGAVASFGLYNQHLQFSQTRIVFATPYSEIKAGQNLATLCQQWQQQQQLSAATCVWLKAISVLRPELRKLQRGVFAVQPSMPLFDVLALYRSGREAQFSFTLKEGQTVAQSLAALSSATFLQNDITSLEALQTLLRWPAEWGPAPVNIEAMFLPETYYYTAHTKASQLYGRAHTALLAAVEQAWQQQQPGLPFTSRYDLLTLASIIEKETGALAEKPLIASVFVNRLRLNMKLQTDPTVIYGLGDRYAGDITRAHLREPHAYNTYVHFGLPPGPIAMVSISSLQAAAQPASSNMLYFVAKGDGTHQFSSNLKAHNAAVAQYIFGRKP